MATPSSDMDDNSNLEFARSGSGEGQEEEEPWGAGTSQKTADLGDLLHDLEHSSSSSSDSDMED